MPLGRMTIAVLISVTGADIALSRSASDTLHRAPEAIQTVQRVYPPRIYPNQRASRSQVRKPMTGLKIIPSKKCWDGSAGTVYDTCPFKPAPKLKAMVVVTAPVNVDVVAWAHSYRAVRIANCESGGGTGDTHTYYDGNPHVHGYYSGKWQMDASFWKTYGGLRYASNSADASEATQDAVAYRGYLSRGWQPWSCSHMV